eukprot:363731-Chlamydomonas_euryale.AAC.7
MVRNRTCYATTASLNEGSVGLGRALPWCGTPPGTTCSPKLVRLEAHTTNPPSPPLLPPSSPRPRRSLTSTQFSEGELKAIVEEAEAVGTYVCAHAYTPPAILRALAAGVRSVEHGNYLDAACAADMAARGAFLVPTIVTYQMLAAKGEGAGMPRELVAKVGDLVEA